MKILKTACIVLCVAAVLAVLAVGIAVKTYLTPQVLEEALSGEMQRQLKRPVSFTISDSDLLGRMSLSNIVIGKSLQWERQELLVCRKARVRVALAPLVFKKIIIRSITLDRPDITLQLNSPALPRLLGKDSFAAVSGAGLHMLVVPERFAINGGTMTIVNVTSGTGVSLSALTVEAKSISLVRPFSWSASAVFAERPDAEISCEGSLFLPAREALAGVVLEHIPLGNICRAFWGEDAFVQDGLLSLDMDFEAKGSSPLSLTGTFDVGKVRTAALPIGIQQERISLEDVDARFAVTAQWDMQKKLISLTDLAGTLFSSDCKGEGVVRYGSGSPEGSLSLQGQSFDTGAFFESVRYSPSGFLQGLRMTGPMNLQMELTLSRNGTLVPEWLLRFKENPVLYPGLGSLKPALDGTVKIDNRSISIARLKVGSPSVSVTVTGDIEDYTKSQPTSNLKVVSSRLDVPALLEAADDQYTEIGPFDFKNLTFRGPLRLGDVLFLGSRISQVQGEYRFENNTLHIDDMRGYVGDGTFRLSASVDLAVRGLDYHGYLKLNDADVKLLTAMANPSYASFVEGTASGTCALKGFGTEPSRVPENLSGDAYLYIHNARLKGLAPIPQLDAIVKSEKLTDMRFDKVGLDLKLRRGVIDVDGAMTNPDMELHPRGEVRLDASLDLVADLKISPEIFSGSTNLGRYLPRDGDWITLPLIVRGSVQEPQVTLEKETLTYILKETLPRLLMDMLGDMKGAGDVGDQGEEDEGEYEE